MFAFVTYALAWVRGGLWSARPHCVTKHNQNNLVFFGQAPPYPSQARAIAQFHSWCTCRKKRPKCWLIHKSFIHQRLALATSRRCTASDLLSALPIYYCDWIEVFALSDFIQWLTFIQDEWRQSTGASTRKIMVPTVMKRRGMKRCSFHRGTSTVGWELSWCGPTIEQEYHKLLAHLFVPFLE